MHRVIRTHLSGVIRLRAWASRVIRHNVPASKRRLKAASSVKKDLRVPIDSIKLHPRNARQHGDRSVNAIAESIKVFGQQRPIIVDRSGLILAGNGTWLAMKKLGEKQIWIRRSELEGMEALAYLLADNRTSELASWDFEELAGMVKAMDADLRRAIGFAAHELAPLLNADFSGTAGGGLRLIVVTNDEHQRIEAAMTTVRDVVGDKKMKDGRSIELIAADFLAGAS